MAREAYCREQARFCRELADQISNRGDAQQLRSMALRYDSEALEGKHSKKGSQSVGSIDPDRAG